MTSPGSTRSVEGEDYARVNMTSLGLNRGPRIAVIYAAGTINSGKSGYDPVNGTVLGSDTLIEYIKQARRDTAVKAHATWEYSHRWRNARQLVSARSPESARVRKNEAAAPRRF